MELQNFDELEQQQQDMERKKRIRSLIGGIGDAVSNAPSIGHYLLKNVPQQDGANQRFAESINDKQIDPVMSKTQKAMAYMKQKKMQNELDSSDPMSERSENLAEMVGGMFPKLAKFTQGKSRDEISDMMPFLKHVKDRNVARGKAPQGYRFTPDGASLEPIPGGPVEVAKQKQKEFEKQSAGIVVEDIDRALDVLKDSDTAAGAWGKYGSWIPGTDAYKLDNILKSVQANVGFDKLQAMRAASPTGGALGAVSEKEMSLLKSAMGNLENSQDEDQLADNLKRVQNIYLDIVHGPGQGPARNTIAFQQKPQSVGGGDLLNSANAGEGDEFDQMSDEQLLEEYKKLKQGQP